MLYDDYLCLVESGKQQVKQVSESGFVQCIAPLPFSRDRRIKMKKSNQGNRFGDGNLVIVDSWYSLTRPRLLSKEYFTTFRRRSRDLTRMQLSSFSLREAGLHRNTGSSLMSLKTTLESGQHNSIIWVKAVIAGICCSEWSKEVSF